MKTSCKLCGKEFDAKPSILARGGAKYCSLECRDESYRKEPLKCEVCGKEFTSHNRRKRTCSKECQYSLRTDITGRIPRIETKCLLCGKEFKQTTAHQRFCSRDCYHLSRRIIESRKCAVCNKEFRPANNKDTAKFCSKKCARVFVGETSIEAIMREALEKVDINFEQEAVIGSYTIDFLIGKLAIECDGIYWHSANVYDRKKDRFLQSQGFKVFRFTDKEIVEDIVGCVAEILRNI